MIKIVDLVIAWTLSRELKYCYSANELTLGILVNSNFED